MEKMSCKERKQVKLLRNSPDIRHVFEDLAEHSVRTPEELSRRWELPVDKTKAALRTLVDADLVVPQVRSVGGSMIYSLSKEGIEMERSGRYREECGDYSF